MTATLRDFLNWFEGISENIETAPTDKQWARIKERLLALQGTPEASGPPAAAPAAVQALEPGVDPDPRGTQVVAKWKDRVRGLLLDVYDEHDAAIELGKITVDLNREPDEVVARLLNGSA